MPEEITVKDLLGGGCSVALTAGTRDDFVELFYRQPDDEWCVWNPGREIWISPYAFGETAMWEGSNLVSFGSDFAAALRFWNAIRKERKG